MKLLYWLPALAYAILIFTLSNQSNPPGADLGPDYILHFVEYGIFALTVVFGLTQGLRKVLTPRLAWIAWGASTLYGLTDEAHQYFIPNRFASAHDVLADSLGAAFVVTLCFFVSRFLRVGER